MEKIVIKTSHLGRQLSENGRVKIAKDTSLDTKRIHEIYYIDYDYYIVYETDKTDYYSKYCVGEIPLLATKLNFTIEDETLWLCPKCGREVEWSSDEPYCPKCGIEGVVREKKVKVLEIVGPDVKGEIEQFASKLFNVKAYYKMSRYSGIAGGERPQFEVHKIKSIKLYNSVVRGATIVQDPVFIETHWDDFEVYKHQDQGMFIVVKTDAEYGDDYHLLSFEGQPQLQILEKLKTEHIEEEKRRKEESKRFEEEKEAKRREEDRRWSDEREVVKEILAKSPSWCDGAVVIQQGVWYGEDADIITIVLPVKKSKFNGDYYSSDEWKEISTQIPERILEKYTNKLILRNGKIVTIETSRKAGSKYLTIKVTGK